ncbi:MAG: FecR family protein [Candidatus Aminicenantes bacterium]|nr:FecR family protein [Candidatus Aminicenantes bacterium]
MKARRISLLFITWVALLALTLPVVASESVSIYGHVSFVEDQATITRSDQTEDRAVVNVPLAPGDTIVTGNNGRCELQFDNGTVVRLDKNTSLRITTVQAPTLTSRWKVTTLHLLQGQLYTLPQTYNQEIFQIITPNAAVKLASRTAATIRFNADLSTALFSDAGKFEALYGADGKTPKKVKVKSGQAYVIAADNILAASSEKRNLEFVAWNEYVDRHFKELHFGISHVPPKLKFGNSALRDWAEKWSSLVGEWVYDELFGYVWRPAEERFANSARPFFNAEYVRINGQLFLVPQEPWGWVPAHMGTWVWLNRGWTWLPGEWFHSGVVEFFGICTFPTMDYYFLMAYSDTFFRQKGLLGWRHDYLRRYYQEVWEQIKQSWITRTELEPNLDILPGKLAKIIKHVNKGPAADADKSLGLDHALSVIGTDKLPPDRGAKLPNAIPDAAGKARPVAELGARKENRHAGGSGAMLDWNPDRHWAEARGYSIRYSSPRNAVICPELNISSDRQSVLHQAGVERMVLPARVYVPENSAPAVSPGSNGDESVSRGRTKDDGSEKKDDPGE